MSKSNLVASRFLRYIGLFLIVSFCTFSVFISIIDTNLLRDYTYTGLENTFYDYRFRQYLEMNNQDKQDQNVVLADIDDESLQTIGRWPWTRTKWAYFLAVMKEAGAKVVAFDVIMSEPEVACNAESPDNILANAINDFQSIPGNHVIMAYLMTDEYSSHLKDVPDILYNSVLDTQNHGGANFKSHKIEDVTFPIKTITDANPTLGYISVSADADGVFRHYPAANNVDDAFYFPAMGLAAYQLYSGDKIKIEVNHDRHGFLNTKNGRLKLDESGATSIRYLGGVNYYPRLNLKTIMDKKADKGALKKFFNGKIVYVGSSATGAHDLRNTPIDTQLPGVYSHMNFTSGLIQSHFFKPSEESLQYSIIILLVGALALILIQQIIGSAFMDILALTVLLVGSYYVDWFFFLPKGYEIKLFFTYFCFVGIYSWNTLLNFSAANKEKKQIKGTFSRYVAPAIVNQMLSEPDKLVLGGEKKDITCIFSDVRDFTSISEKLTPTELSQCLNIYMSKMTNILFDTYGTLDKYIGDAIVGYWGAPLEIEHHAYHAVRGAVQMIEALPAINDQFKAQGFPQFKVGIGLNSGECSVGNMGSDKIFSYTALGDNMNLGSRLESLCKYYGVQINISEFTLRAIPQDKKNEFTFRSLDIVRVKGKEKPVRIYEVLHNDHPFKKDDKAREEFEHAYTLYLEGKFMESMQILDDISSRYPEDKPTKLIKAHCEEYLEHPPAQPWDGVTTHKEK